MAGASSSISIYISIDKAHYGESKSLSVFGVTTSQKFLDHDPATTLTGFLNSETSHRSNFEHSKDATAHAHSGTHSKQSSPRDAIRHLYPTLHLYRSMERCRWTRDQLSGIVELWRPRSCSCCPAAHLTRSINDIDLNRWYRDGEQIACMGVDSDNGIRWY